VKHAFYEAWLSYLETQIDERDPVLLKPAQPGIVAAVR
jgi:hypothetical protein